MKLVKPELFRDEYILNIFVYINKSSFVNHDNYAASIDITCLWNEKKNTLGTFW